MTGDRRNLTGQLEDNRLRTRTQDFERLNAEVLGDRIDTRRPPRCEKHGLVMVEKFRHERINDFAERAIPTGEYSCLACDDADVVP